MLCLSFYLWVDCNYEKKPCILLVDCNQDLKPCKIHFIKLVFISIQSMTMKHFDHVFCILFFSIKNKWRPHTTYPKREVPLQAPESLFLRAPSPYWGSFAVSHNIISSRVIIRIKHKIGSTTPNSRWPFCRILYKINLMYIQHMVAWYHVMFHLFMMVVAFFMATYYKIEILS